jgi:hypothetical protein
MEKLAKVKAELKAKLILRGINNIRLQSALQSAQIQKCLESFFDNFPSHAVIQVGANGRTLDPIQARFLSHHGPIVMIEPIQYLCNELRAQFNKQSNIKVEKCLIGSGLVTRRRLFFIDPEVADEMDGSGPPNKWAHGQGSFNIESIHYWIERNKFRGKNYRLNIDKYKSSVLSEEVRQVSLAKIVNDNVIENFGLLIVDVQGAELEVVKSLNGSLTWPSIIVCETDGTASCQNSVELDHYLNDCSYIKIYSSTDSLWIRI